MRPTASGSTIATLGLSLMLSSQSPLCIVLLSSSLPITLAFPISIRSSLAELPDLSDLPEKISSILPDIPNPLSKSISDDEPESTSSSPPPSDILSSQSVPPLPPPGQLVLSQSHTEIFPLSCSVTPIGGGGIALHWRQRDGSCKSTQETNVRGLFMFVLDEDEDANALREKGKVEEELETEDLKGLAKMGKQGKPVWVRDEQIRVWDH